VRDLTDEPLTLLQLSQVLWAATGITSQLGFRTAPSAGATYPLELFVVVGNRAVSDLVQGVYRYLPEGHSLVPKLDGDLSQALAGAALGQGFIAQAPVSLVVCASYERTTNWYGWRGERYVHMEVGHVGQNIHLQAEALGLGTVPVGAFDDGAVQRVLGIEKGIEPLYIMPLGKPA
jgi:SagB-type dehydrogenase family enzyme